MVRAQLPAGRDAQCGVAGASARLRQEGLADVTGYVNERWQPSPDGIPRHAIPARDAHAVEASVRDLEHLYVVSRAQGSRLDSRLQWNRGNLSDDVVPELIEVRRTTRRRPILLGAADCHSAIL